MSSFSCFSLQSLRGFTLHKGEAAAGGGNTKTMNIKKLNSILFLIVIAPVFAQQDGYWDKDRSTTKEITVSAGARIVAKTEDFPIGTTEVVYRITLLDENQQMANSLVSLLKSIPDPTGISQGSAGAVFLLSKVSGDDKCNYAVFSGSAPASEYMENGKTEKACLYQSAPVNKDARRLSLDKSACFQSDSGNLWFGFESKNWIMKQKIILEVVPWVDIKLNRGWNTENKKVIISLAKTSDLVKRMLSPDDFCLCILEKMENKYRYVEFSKLLAIEKSKAFRDFGNQCLTEKPANKSILNAIRNDAVQYFVKGRYQDAIELMLIGIVDNGNAMALDYNALGKYYLFSKQYGKAIKVLKDGQSSDSSELLIQLNLAHAYVLNNDFSKAKEIYKKHKGQNVTAGESWGIRAKSDIAALKQSGIMHEDFDKVLKLLD